MLQRILAGIGLLSLGFLSATLLMGSEEEIMAQKKRHLSQDALTVSPPLPQKVDFCKEQVPLERFDVREMLEKQVVRTVYNRPHTMLIIKRANRWKATFQRILREQGIPEDFFYLMVAESAVENARSWAGAQGFWQFMEATGKEYGLEINEYVDERNHPIISAYAACEYFKKSFARFGNWSLVAASYNMGIGGVQVQINRQKAYNYHNLYLNPETGNYLYRILAYKIIMEAPEAYGFKLFPGDLYEPVEYETVIVDEPIEDLVKFARDHGTTYKLLKVMNPWLLKSSLPNEDGKQYKLLIVKEENASRHLGAPPRGEDG